MVQQRQGLRLYRSWRRRKRCVRSPFWDPRRRFSLPWGESTSPVRDQPGTERPSGGESDRRLARHETPWSWLGIALSRRRATLLIGPGGLGTGNRAVPPSAEANPGTARNAGALLAQVLMNSWRTHGYSGQPTDDRDITARHEVRDGSASRVQMRTPTKIIAAERESMATAALMRRRTPSSRITPVALQLRNLQTWLRVKQRRRGVLGIDYERDQSPWPCVPFPRNSGCPKWSHATPACGGHTRQSQMSLPTESWMNYLWNHGTQFVQTVRPASNGLTQQVHNEAHRQARNVFGEAVVGAS